MKTFKVTSCLLLFVTLIQTSLAVVPTSNQPVQQYSSGNSNLVKATRVHGEWIPVVDLPLIEITGLKKESTIVGMIPGKNRVYANLPMIEIKAESLVPGKIKTGCRNGDALILADLPVIEVVADFPANRLLSTVTAENIPVVTLPEIVVSAEPKGLLAEAMVTSTGTVNPLVTLPEIKIEHYGGSGNSGIPYFYSMNHRWGYFIADHGRRMVEKMIRAFIF